MLFRQLNPHSCLTYLIGSEENKEVFLVDPVLEHVSDYLNILKKGGMRLTHAIDTHTHADHISGGSALKDRTGCEYVMYIQTPVRCVTFRVTDGLDLNMGGMLVKAMHTPGHTKDSICLVFNDRILTGDTLFLDDGGAGRDDLPGGDAGEHWESLQRILKLPDNLIVYPAHEYRNRQPSSLKEQKMRNTHLRHRTKEEYLKYVQDLKLGPAEWMEKVLKANYACARDPMAAWIPADSHACEVRGTLEHGVNDIPVSGISIFEIKQRLDSGNIPLLLDVRDVEELTGEFGHISGIRNIPIDSLSGRLREMKEDREKEIITICKSGGRAHTAAQILIQAGFKNVYVMSGGMKAWKRAGYPVSDKRE